jgi:type I restriction enzyme S subunit
MADQANKLTFQNNMINLLQERRTALISAAVTGKIDGRDWVPTSPTTNPNND